MRIIDFLFYYLSVRIHKTNKKYGIRRIDHIAWSCYILGIFTIVWLLHIDRIVEFLIFHLFKSRIPKLYFVLIGICLMVLFNYVYIEKGRYNRILEKQNSESPLFNISIKTGTVMGATGAVAGGVVIVLTATGVGAPIAGAIVAVVAVYSVGRFFYEALKGK